MSPSVTTTWAMALNSATLAPGRTCRWQSASMCGDPDQGDLARIDDDEPGALPQPPLQLRGEHRMAFGRVRADDDDDVRLHHGVEGLRAGRLANRALQPVAGRRVADARAGVDVVVAERGAHELLHEERLLVRAARGRDAADRVAAVLRLDAPELARRVADRLVPADLLPRIVDRRADHRRRDAVGMRRIPEREPAL